MLIALTSDNHLEFGDLIFSNEQKAEVLILSGDILLADVLKNYSRMVERDPNGILTGDGGMLAHRFHRFLKMCSDEFPHVVYVGGNHELYGGDWNGSIQTLRDECAKYPNIHFLENDVWEHNGIKFVGGTLWTDLNNHDQMTIFHLSQCMNDYRKITNDSVVANAYSSGHYSKLHPLDTYARHKKTLAFIQHVVDNDKNAQYVVVGHHAPSKISTKPGYEEDVLMNGGYSSNLDEFIMDRPQILLWTCGHTHFSHRYYIGDTMIANNARGYDKYEQCAIDFKLKYIDLGNMPSKEIVEKDFYWEV